MPMALSQQESARAPMQVMLRFGTFLLACVLLALYWGRSLPHGVAEMCQLFGLCGLAFYFVLEAVADQRARKEECDSDTPYCWADQRLSQRIRAEDKMACIVKGERVTSFLKG